MRILFQSDNDFDLDSAGAVIAAGVRFVDFTWPSYVVTGGTGNIGNGFPVFELTGPASRLAADTGGVQLVDMSGGTLASQYVDVVRYGRI